MSNSVPLRVGIIGVGLRGQGHLDLFLRRENGLDVEYIVFEDEGHGFAKPENRMEFYGKAEQFLAKYLGGRTEVPPVHGVEGAAEQTDQRCLSSPLPRTTYFCEVRP